MVMKIAIPVADGVLASHFGHCERFALLEVELEQRKMLARNDIVAPPHEPGLLPRWLAEHGADMIIAGGMGERARELFSQSGIKVFTGAPPVDPEQLVHHFMHGSLSLGANQCEH